MPYISFIVAFIASECIKGFLLKTYGAALCILSFTACLLKPQSILNFEGHFAFVSKSIPLVDTDFVGDTLFDCQIMRPLNPSIVGDTKYSVSPKRSKRGYRI